MSKLGRLLPLVCLPLLTCSVGAQQAVLKGKDAFIDYTQEKPGVRRLITPADLPSPSTTESVDGVTRFVARPGGMLPEVPPGFKVTLYAGDDKGPVTVPDPGYADKKKQKKAGEPDGLLFHMPRLIRTAPNGDLFLSDTTAGTIFVMRGVTDDGKAQKISAFATGLNHPFGIAFYPLGESPEWVYIATTTSILRYAYKNGDLQASGPAQYLNKTLPSYVEMRTGFGHSTRDVVFTLDGKRMLVSVGSASDANDPDTHPEEQSRADVLEFKPDGNYIKVYASGLRNCAGEAVNPTTGELWCSTNERNWMGDNLVPDYISSVPEGSFFGWPWFYTGSFEDPRFAGKHPELKSKVKTPDVLLNAHVAPLEMVFYPTTEAQHGAAAPFPNEYQGDAFAAEHGSMNRRKLVGYEVIRVPMKNGKATGEQEDFMTGFVLPNGNAWGRPVGVAVGRDGSLFVSDDVSRSVWRVSYVGK